MMNFETLEQTISICNFDFKVKTIRDFNKTSEWMKKQFAHSKEPAPYFGLVWESAKGVSEWLCKKPDQFFRDQKILEIGCGVAIPSMLCALRGASVTASDFHPSVGELLAINVAANKQVPPISYKQMDWSSTHNTLDFDTIIGSDIIYSREKAISLVEFVRSAIAQGVKQVVIADCGRPFVNIFQESLKTLCLSVSTESVQVAHLGKTVDIQIMIISGEKKTGEL